MKTYLIPSDFTTESLKVLDVLALAHQIIDAKIVFLHAFKLSDSISDMLLLSRRSRDFDGISDEFINTLNTYKNKYSKNFSAFGIEHFYGSTTAVFKNFLEAQEIDTIVSVQGKEFSAINKYSINPSVLIERAGYPVLNVNIEAITLEENLAEWTVEEQALRPSLT